MHLERNSRKLIAMLEREGWFLVEVKGDHHQFKHAERPGRVTVPHPNKDIPIGTLRSVYRQAGWLER
ncbi:type II toxin-antitoxin system HicA family toxin [Devosia aurantiaca]|uniref:Type II toxin-antitoxin system HicA family toxin n=1 Tax=Devosia aurantiaca TaxID=2714858 RepID=A0A6M1SJQ1_9HYPH|nr:type II toxin-antitoxin system HicA family toxin [Devosia aurantiaca]NGP17370.1 type II toxin-antitoxin system HicA family toxin [Devosia aurantiaca]